MEQWSRHTFRKAAKVVLFILTAYAVLHWGDQLGLLEADAWINLRRDENLTRRLDDGHGYSHVLSSPMN